MPATPLKCFDAFPSAERHNQRLWEKGRSLPGWYPSLARIFPMIVCRVLPLGGVPRPVIYSRVLGHAGRPGHPAVWMGGYHATLLADREGWPLFRMERLIVPRESEQPFDEVLERLLTDAEQIALGIGVKRFQVALLEVPEGELPGFPTVGSPFGPLADSRPAEALVRLGFERLEDHGYYRAPADSVGGAGIDGPGRAYRWGEEDLVRYGQLWTEHCTAHLEAYQFLAARTIPLDTRLQHRMDMADRLSRIRFLGEGAAPVGLVSWYPDLHPQMLADGGDGARVRRRLGSFDAGAVTAAKVIKCLAPRAAEGSEEGVLAQGLAWAGSAALKAHPNLQWLQVGPVAPSHRTLLDVLERSGFECFGGLTIFERKLSRFSNRS